MVTQLSVPVQSVSSIKEEVARRKADQIRIRAATNAFLADVRGIPDFLDLADAALPPQSDALTLYMGRQIPTACIEHIAMDFLAEWMSVAQPSVAQVVAFTSDNWAPGGHKQSVTSPQLVTRVCENRVHLRAMSVVPKSFRIMSSRPVLASIPAQCKWAMWGFDSFDGMLPAFHSLLRSKAGLNGSGKHDASGFWSECVRRSRKPPPTVFCEVDGCAVSRPAEFIGQEIFVRPPASWFYLAYLCLFLTGERALVATAIEDDDESIQQLFVRSIALIEERTGVAPLILETPHHSPRLIRSTGDPIVHPVDFTEIHPAVFQPGWRDHITLPPQDVSFYEAAEMILHQLATMPVPVRERVM